VKETLPLFL